ncbi:MAG: hypothetical protein ACYC92_08850 [Candidatus Acidiferrales bacterium]
MKTDRTSSDKKFEALLESIPPEIVKYFFLLSLVAGVICSLLTTAGTILIFVTHRSWMTGFRGLEPLIALIFFVLATREMFLAFKDYRRNDPHRPSGSNDS